MNDLDQILLDDQGFLRVLDWKEIADIPSQDIMIWCNLKGVYCLPTIELIEWLKDQINQSYAIEICSGNGAIGRALNIIHTDSYIQTTKEMVSFYEMLGQNPIFPPTDVVKHEANDAVDLFGPEVVIGSFVTQKYLPGDEGLGIGSSIYGVDELALIPKVKKYITIGNYNVHKDKRSRHAYRNKVFHFPWIVTRCFDPSKNEIVVWEN